MKVTPMGERVLIKRCKAEEVAKGGIIIPDTAQEKPLKAEVAALGKGKQKEDGSFLPFEVKVGDTILIGRYAGQDISIDGENYVIVSESDILAILS
ncbi:MAG: co-chaperone GroES [Candidatus Auribacter fodinae]|jgi:chaperonin GroES|uniref:Co-chaperonin GroES n=1 Tax=Candidatus Auribacter fodinae TaxID=2093366 RepID=A0A3A4R8Q1_9BACT|nr:MAG: co-chaperone GroES [Candidatus Auribacter fodinae]